MREGHRRSPILTERALGRFHEYGPNTDRGDQSHGSPHKEVIPNARLAMVWFHEKSSDL